MASRAEALTAEMGKQYLQMGTDPACNIWEDFSCHTTSRKKERQKESSLHIMKLPVFLFEKIFEKTEKSTCFFRKAVVLYLSAKERGQMRR